MTITSDSKRIVYAATGAATFPFDWRILAAEDLKVIVSTPAGVDTLQTLITDFTVSGVGNPAGSITFEAASIPVAPDRVTIILDPPLTQLTDYSAGGSFPSQAHEDALDRVVNVNKRTRDFVDRTMLLFDGDVSGSGRFEAGANRIVNLEAPVDGTDAATLGYVQSQIASAILDPSVTVSAAAADVIDEPTFEEMLIRMGAGAEGLLLFYAPLASDALDVLNISPYSQLLLQLDDSADARSAIDVGVEQSNLIINGDFQVWQNGTSFTVSDDNYIADQFILLQQANSSVTFSKFAAAPGGGRGSALAVQVIDNSKWAVVQVIDNARTEPLRIKIASGSVDLMNVGGTLTDMRLHLIYWTGTPDVVTSDVVSAWNAATTNPTLVAGWNYIAASQTDCVVGATWATFKFEGITVPGGARNLALLLVTNDSDFTVGGSANCIMSNFTLVNSPIAADFVGRSYETELQDCRKFFRSTFPRDVAPVQNAGTAGSLIASTSDIAGGAATIGQIYWSHGVEMLRTPTYTTYNPNAANANWRDIGNTADRVVSVVGGDRSGVLIQTDTAVDLDNYRIHVTADARL